MIRLFPLKEDPCASVPLSQTPVEILKGTLHPIKREARQGSDGFCHQSKSSMFREGLHPERPALSRDLPQCELLALSSVLQVLVCAARSWWELAEVIGGEERGRRE